MKTVREGGLVKTSMLKAVITDVHFWAPVAVLAAGFALLFMMQ